MLSQLRQSNGNPLDVFRQVTSGYSPEQMQNLFANAEQMGVPKEVLTQLQNGINANSVDIKKE